MTWLGIDLGTGSTKAAVVGDDGRVLGLGTRAHPVRSPVPGAAETAPQDWVVSVRRAAAEALAAAGDPTVDAVGLSGQMHGVVCADAEVRPLRPALLWADVRAGEQCRAYDRLDPAERRALGNPVVPGMLGPLLTWALASQPGLRGRLAWALSPKDWLRAALTGAVATEPSDASATLLWDVPASRWSATALAALDVPAQALPPVVASAQVAGRLHDDGAALLGLPRGTPVAAGAADVAAGLAGSGLTAGQVQLSIGTGAQVVVAVDDLVIAPRPLTHRYRRAEPHGWYAMAAVQNAGLALEWVRGVLGATWDDLHASLDGVAPGAGGVTFHGYLTGERTPVLDTALRGAWQGLGLHTDRAALLRSALEGVAFAVRHGLEALVAEGVAVGDIRLVGGGSGDRRWRALLAGVLGRPLTVHPVSDASALGAARLAATALGATLPPAPAGDAVTVAPDPAASAALDEAWRHWRARHPPSP